MTFPLEINYDNENLWDLHNKIYNMEWWIGHSPIVGHKTGFPLQYRSVHFLFRRFHIRVHSLSRSQKNTNKKKSKNVQQKIISFQRKNGLQKEKISKYFKKLVIQVKISICYHFWAKITHSEGVLLAIICMVHFQAMMCTKRLIASLSREIGWLQ